MTTRVQVRLFARLRETCGASEMTLELPDGADAAACFERLREVCSGPGPSREGLAVAVNEEYATWDRRLEAGDVVSFIPPVSGGRDAEEAGEGLVEVTAAPIAASVLRERVVAPGVGAVATFEGTVRDRTGDFLTDHLEYEAYVTMATRTLRTIADEARKRFEIHEIAIHHRVGRLEIGEVSVAIAVGAAHRDAAFAACRHAIEELKARAPIWKKEVGPDGAAWIEGPTRKAGS